ncbi:hypothetical protein BU23DRAFT_184046 [Bimuria novae-zelandiae CBS 107.79]|uniref:Uncharacterized protein n=1 Tax=Bimuria novae-zelandiae CBS 107.79 TaxID=1447943 RepID=A0A6A5VE39_9PLEO|nr:hypothetical protein BU23DRAFT_184046 [Bimuria novae-zelandiae CBS 107.79]
MGLNRQEQTKSDETCQNRQRKIRACEDTRTPYSEMRSRVRTTQVREVNVGQQGSSPALRDSRATASLAVKPYSEGAEFLKALDMPRLAV